MELIINIVLLSLLALTAIVIVRSRDLFAAVILLGIYSLLCASLFVVMDAVDVAFTEAVVGAGISTLLMLKTLAITRRHQSTSSAHRPGLALLLVLVCGALLIYGTWDIPAFGSASAPVHQHVAPYYLANSLSDTGVFNVVTAILASYRGFDTLGELVVIFTAGVGVLALLTKDSQSSTKHNGAAMQQHMVLRTVAKMLIPLLLVFAFYVQFHGDYGPGGGFQAGVIFAVAIILYAMLFGEQVAQQVITKKSVQRLAALGVMLFGGVGIVSILLGGNFLNYSVLLADSVSGQHLGILLVELGVGITVAAVMIMIFYSFIRHQNKTLESANDDRAV